MNDNESVVSLTGKYSKIIRSGQHGRASTTEGRHLDVWIKYFKKRQGEKAKCGHMGNT